MVSTFIECFMYEHVDPSISSEGGHDWLFSLRFVNVKDTSIKSSPQLQPPTDGNSGFDFIVDRLRQRVGFRGELILMVGSSDRADLYVSHECIWGKGRDSAIPRRRAFARSWIPFDGVSLDGVFFMRE